MLRIIEISGREELRQLMQEIKVDRRGIEIMLPKANNYLIRINSISAIAANILKQEMLSLGGDVAVARGALTARRRKTDCLIMGSLAEIVRLKDKLKRQPFGLEALADNLSLALKNYQCRHNRKVRIMGIVNLTPDSFSGDGLYKGLSPEGTLPKIIDFVEQMVKDGADIIDVGGESSRPGARPVPVKEELKRTIPVIKALAKKIKVSISVDTYKPLVAQQALDNGAVIVNDITGLRNKQMIKVVAQHKAGAVVMHMRGQPRTMQKNIFYNSLMDEIIAFLAEAINRGLDGGIAKDKIIVDPGIGFGKGAEHNLELLRKLKEFKILGQPILVGVSRKSFIGQILKVEPKDRLFGTIAACVLAVRNGANIVRVHDVKEVAQALRVSAAICGNQ